MCKIGMNGLITYVHRKNQCKLFSLEECSDIEPIGEDDEADRAICEVQVCPCVTIILYVQYVNFISKLGIIWQIKIGELLNKLVLYYLKTKRYRIAG